MQVGGGGGKVGDLVMTWEPLPAEDQNGEGIGYIVYWKKKYLIDEEWSSVRTFCSGERGNFGAREAMFYLEICPRNSE